MISRCRTRTQIVSYTTIILQIICFYVPLVTSQDNRCYLLEGGSSETFTVNERIEIGEVIGKLQILGSVGDNGNISLYLSNEEIVSFEPGTKDLILMKKLDKEGRNGPSSASLIVYCNRTGTSDPPLPIPVRIFVTDYNDNAPEFVGAPYIVNVSEVTVVESIIIDTIKAIDMDQQGPSSTVEYFFNPHQTYAHFLRIDSSLEGKVVLNNSLDYETLPIFTVAIGAQDQGKPRRRTLTNLTIRVLDADDQNPKFQHDKYTAILPDNPVPGTLLEVSPDSVRAYDPDFGINASVSYSFTAADAGVGYDYFELDQRTGNIFVKQQLSEDVVTPITLVIQATQDDNADRYTLTTVSIHERRATFNTNTLQFLLEQYHVAIPEGATLLHRPVLTLQTNKPSDKGVSFTMVDDQDIFTINKKGEIILQKELDYEKKKFHMFKVSASYRTMNATTEVNVTVMDNNDHDPVFNQTLYTFYLNDDDPIPGAFVGKVEVSDGDNDKVRLSLTGPHSKAFYIYDDGIVRIKDVDIINSSETQLIVVATDTGEPPRQSSVPVTVMVPSKLALAKRASPTQSVILMIIFGSVLGILLLIIITLTLYIVKNKKYRNRLTSMMMSPSHPPKAKTGGSYTNGTISRNMLPDNRNGPAVTETQTRALGVENPIFNMPENNNTEQSPRIGNRQKTRPIKVQPVQPPRVPDTVRSNGHLKNGSISSGTANHNNICVTPPPPSAFMSENDFKPNNFNMNGKIGSVHWPNGSIPRRVKKLSWEDEQANLTELDPDVSATPFHKNQQTNENSQSNDLTIYF